MTAGLLRYICCCHKLQKRRMRGGEEEEYQPRGWRTVLKGERDRGEVLTERIAGEGAEGREPGQG